MNEEADIKILLGYSGAEFVYAAYRLYLRREPDREGMKNFLAALMTGVRKEEILAELCMSEEGRSRGCSPETLSNQLKSGGKEMTAIRGQVPFLERFRRGLKRRILFGFFREYTEMFINQQIAMLEVKRSTGVYRIPITGIANSGSGTTGLDDRGIELPNEVFRIYSQLKGGDGNENCV